MTRYLACVLLVSACVETESIELGAWPQRAEVHVDTTQPDALATTDVVLDFYGGTVGRYVRVDGIYVRPDPQAVTLELELELADGAVYVPANAWLTLPLVNQGVHNSELAAHCQSAMPMTLYLGVPAEPELSLALIHDFIVFCP